MISFLRLLGLAVIVGVALLLSLASVALLAALAVAFLCGFGILGFGLCVLAGQITKADRDEANGLKHPDNIGDQN